MRGLRTYPVRYFFLCHLTSHCALYWYGGWSIPTWKHSREETASSSGSSGGRDVKPTRYITAKNIPHLFRVGWPQKRVCSYRKLPTININIAWYLVYQFIEFSMLRIEGVLPTMPSHSRSFFADTERNVSTYRVSKWCKSILVFRLSIS